MRTVLLAGTAMPNCVHTTCCDVLALDYNAVVEIQRVNPEDMTRAGALLMDNAAFSAYGPDTVRDLTAAARAAMPQDAPEPFSTAGRARVGWTPADECGEDETHEESRNSGGFHSERNPA